ncbi:ATP-dependent DNA ligase [Streptomyces sp. NPDC056492]|uniref:ATP-dependent DNA ligase n=1 Tax=unclassified Streptomyces TaxID=2593676 RepID=UPI0036AD99A5
MYVGGSRCTVQHRGHSKHGYCPAQERPLSRQGRLRERLNPGTCTSNSANRKTTREFRAFELQECANPRASAFDLLAHPDLGDVRGRPYVERRGLLLELLEEVGPPIQAVPATDDRDVALVWYEVLQEQGIEGIVAKRATSPYRGGRRIWQKVRHSEVVDVDVVGYTGTAARPRHLVVALPGGRIARSQRLSPLLAGEIGTVLAAATTSGVRARLEDGEPYVTTTVELVVEVAAGTTRHPVVSVVRVHD